VIKAGQKVGEDGSMTIIAMRNLPCSLCPADAKTGVAPLLTINIEVGVRIECDTCSTSKCEDSYGCKKCEKDYCLNCVDKALERLGTPIVSKEKITIKSVKFHAGKHCKERPTPDKNYAGFIVYSLGTWKHPEGKDIQPGYACIMDIKDMEFDKGVYSEDLY